MISGIRKLKKKVKGAMTYPIVTLIIAVVVLAVILVFVIYIMDKHLTIHE